MKNPTCNTGQQSIKNYLFRIFLVTFLIAYTFLLPAYARAGKEGSAFFPARMLNKMRGNVKKNPSDGGKARSIIESARFYSSLTDEELWGLMFGNSIKRSWMVWSNGYCPTCRSGVPMYAWEVNAQQLPWKVRCPHCKETFPKNDFYSFYRSGLNEKGIFEPARADHSLLYNAEHPAPSDPLHLFGVDDGEGYVAEGKRWRFIGAYLIYGQWKQVVLGGISKLSDAYVVTGDPDYAHKAGILLDRVADLYPTFDFSKEGVLYEGPGCTGYVSVWHDSCGETRELALSYDKVFEALKQDRNLISFLSGKAASAGLENRKTSWDDIGRNIEERILIDALNNREKILSNYPQGEITVIIINTVLGWPANREEIYIQFDNIIRKGTAVDGVTGEKGLSGYSTIAPQSLAQILALFTRIDPFFLRDIIGRHSSLREMFRFHIDTWCLQKYYPRSGDTGSFGFQTPVYAGVSFSDNPGIMPSMFTFLWDLYTCTRDPAFAQVMYLANGKSLKGLPYDLMVDEPAVFQKNLGKVINSEGPEPILSSVNKEQWHLGILRSGAGKNSRALWLDYDSGCQHGHLDGMTLGLFARGFDLMPDFGYPPVQYGGWGSPQAQWYRMTTSHNTVVVDGVNQRIGSGKTTLWADGRQFHAIRASARDLIGGMQYERTAALIDVNEEIFYLLDVFRVIGGRDHCKFIYGNFGSLSTRGLDAGKRSDWEYPGQIRNLRCDPSPQTGWCVDWKIEDRYNYLSPGTPLNLRYLDLSEGAKAFLGEGWITRNLYNSNDEAWIPVVLIRRHNTEGTLDSTFVGTIECYGETPHIARVRRLPIESGDGSRYSSSNVAVEMTLEQGKSDLIITADVENPMRLAPSFAREGALRVNDWDVTLKGEMCWIRRDLLGHVEGAALCRAKYLKAGQLEIELKRVTDYLEISLDRDHFTVEKGSVRDLRDVRVNGKSLPEAPGAAEN